MRIEDRQLSVAAVLVVSLAGACLVLSPSPAYAGWGKNLARSVLPSLVRRAAVSLIQQELYDLESNGNQQQFAPSYPTSNVVQPGFHRMSEPKLAASPMQAPSGYQWTPRSAMDYLQDDGGKSSNPLSGSGTIYNSLHPVTSSAVAQSFQRGLAGQCSYEELVKANVFVSCPLHGSIFKRQGTVKYIILHSTETGSPADARRVIQSWNNRGLRHPGAQFVVDRDGTICSTVDPDQATVHIDTSKTLAGYSNDNSVGIEIVRSGKQQYTKVQLESVTRLVTYLQSHYGISDACVTTHHHVQPSDRSDPVNFDLVAFENDKSALQTFALAHGARIAARGSQIATHGVQIGSSPQIADAKHELQMMPKPAPDFRLRRN